jgi:hypothetical protein
MSPGVQGPRRLRLVGDVSRLGLAVDYVRLEARARIAQFLTAFETPALRLTFGKPSVAVEKFASTENPSSALRPRFVLRMALRSSAPSGSLSSSLASRIGITLTHPEAASASPERRVLLDVLPPRRLLGRSQIV